MRRLGWGPITEKFRLKTCTEVTNNISHHDALHPPHDRQLFRLPRGPTHAPILQKCRRPIGKPTRNALLPLFLLANRRRFDHRCPLRRGHIESTTNTLPQLPGERAQLRPHRRGRIAQVDLQPGARGFGETNDDGVDVSAGEVHRAGNPRRFHGTSDGIVDRRVDCRAVGWSASLQACRSVRSCRAQCEFVPGQFCRGGYTPSRG
mmetsp:Transcript_14364/g.30717  ORF Transcript_14364/g.30717 Transcript_14364/m.30717 type:complete len:205 (-) Transcript_14364:188-802(-)